MRSQSLRGFGLLCVVIIAISLSGCFTYRATAPEQPGATDPQSQVIWSFAWGLANGIPKIDNCNGQPLSEVTVRSNLAFDLLTVVTLGIVSPKIIEWRCATAEPPLAQTATTPNQKTQLAKTAAEQNVTDSRDSATAGSKK